MDSVVNLVCSTDFKVKIPKVFFLTFESSVHNSTA